MSNSLQARDLAKDLPGLHMRGRLINLHAQRLVPIYNARFKPTVPVELDLQACAEWDVPDGIPEVLLRNAVIPSSDADADELSQAARKHFDCRCRLMTCRYNLLFYFHTWTVYATTVYK